MKADFNEKLEREKELLKNVKDLREEDPGIGAYKLWRISLDLYGGNQIPGRDSFYTLLRRHGLMLPAAKPRHTTNSNHHYHKWKNLIKGINLQEANKLWVADITYISIKGGDTCYLHLITDAYSHKVIGWQLSETLKASASLEALREAIEQTGQESLEGLIHHSDRGAQYCCNEYVEMLHKHGINISMTEDYKPTDNAIAERINGIIKTEFVYRKGPFNSITHARNLIGEFIHFYNYYRPHMSIGNKVPALTHIEKGPQKKMWKNKIYPPKSKDKEIKGVTLQNQTTSQGESTSH